MSEPETQSPELIISDMADQELADTNSVEKLPRDRRVELVQRIWETLNGSGFLSAVAVALFLLYLFTLFLPQMPSQLQGDLAGAQRWMLQMSEGYGPLGNGFRALGLFSVLSSPLLQLLIILLALIILTQLGDYLAKAWRLYQIRQQLHSEISAVGAPLQVPTVQPIYRLRQAIRADATKLMQQIRNDLQKRFVVIKSNTIHLPVSDIPVSDIPVSDVLQAADMQGSPPDADASPGFEAVAESVVERRLFALGDIRFALLRPVLFIGLFFTLLTIWIIVLWGWTLNPDPLAPGAEYRSVAQRVALRYEVTEQQPILPSSAVVETTAERNASSASPIAVDENVIGSAASITDPQITGAAEAMTDSVRIPMLVATVGEQTFRAPIYRAIHLNWGQTVITSRAGPPALYLRTTSNEPQLSRLGQSQTVPSMGLLFPSPGSEESIVVAQALGLRIIRLPQNDNAEERNQFLAEVYDANNLLIKRISIKERVSTELLLDDPTGAQPIMVEFIALPGMALEVAHRPAMWLFWPALLLSLVGIIGFARQPAFVLLQFAPWPIDRTVVIVQSDEKDELMLMQELIEKAAK